MTCLIVSTLELHKDKLREKRIDVVKRYIKLKLKIDISRNALMQKLQYIH